MISDTCKHTLNKSADQGPLQYILFQEAATDSHLLLAEICYPASGPGGLLGSEIAFVDR